MREQQIDILDDRVLSKADAICFTSNGILNSNGHLVMGAGVAKAFKHRFPGLDAKAGDAVMRNGNLCQIVSLEYGTPIIAFPTKQDWRDSSDIGLIRKSSLELMELVERENWNKVALPRPGCRNGGLNWKDVKEAIEPILDDRIVVVWK